MMLEIVITIVVIVLLVLIVLLKLTKVPKQVYMNKTAYSDHREKVSKAFYSSKYDLTGKPDYILHTKDGPLPLEIKNTKRPKKPYFSHVMQLVSYCLLMEEDGKKPKYGFIQYKGGKAFSVSYTDKMKEKLISIMNKMKKINSKPKARRSYRCDKCGYFGDCF